MSIIEYVFVAASMLLVGAAGFAAGFDIGGKERRKECEELIRNYLFHHVGYHYAKAVVIARQIVKGDLCARYPGMRPGDALTIDKSWENESKGVDAHDGV